MSTITVVAGKPTLPGEIRYYPMAVSQTFSKGEFVYLDNNGRLTVCATDPGGIAGMAAESYAEALAAAGSASTATTLGVACAITLAKRGQQFTLHVTNAGSTTTTANNQVGHEYSLYRDTTNKISLCDVGDASNRIFVVDCIAPEDTVGDTSGRVIVEVKGSFAQLDSGTS